MENHFQKSKRPQTHLLMSFNSIGIMGGYIFGINKNQCLEWLVLVSWCFQPNYCYINFQYVIAIWKIILQKKTRVLSVITLGLIGTKKTHTGAVSQGLQGGCRSFAAAVAGQKNKQMSCIFSFAHVLVAFICCLTYCWLLIIHICRMVGGWSSIASNGFWNKASCVVGGNWDRNSYIIVTACL